MSTISVVVSTWNRISDLQKCITSILSQDVHICELIIIDNTSVDGTDIYCNEVVYDHCLHNNINFIYEQVQCSALEALNFGYSLATSDYIITVDDDAYMMRNDTFRLLKNTLDDHFDVWIAGCSIVPDKNLYTDTIDMVYVHEVMGALFIMRNDSISRFDESLGIYGNELDLSVRMRTYGRKTVLLSGLYVYHPFRVDTFQNNRERIRIRNAFNILKYFNINYKIKLLIVYIIGCTWELYVLFPWYMMVWWILYIPYIVLRSLIRSGPIVDIEFQKSYYEVRKAKILNYLHLII